MFHFVSCSFELFLALAFASFSHYAPFFEDIKTWIITTYIAQLTKLNLNHKYYISIVFIGDIYIIVTK
jgi:hypothetical protein